MAEIKLRQPAYPHFCGFQPQISGIQPVVDLDPEYVGIALLLELPPLPYPVPVDIGYDPGSSRLP
ncbi:hypothetical protein [Pseudochelatococcus sp.]|uniref:hypothetical protein n=1 Tax=Pseudochelatococcus sp. TaxID=2020869 RepID=UPI003D915D0E